METNARATSSTGGRGRRARGRKFKKLSNDELFYDPNMDDEDEKWVRRQRMAYHNGEGRGLIVGYGFNGEGAWLNCGVWL